MSDFRSGLPVRLFDEDNLPYTEDNPLPVSLEESEGDEIHDYKVDEDVAAHGASPASHEYTVSTGKKLNLKKVLFAGSGRMKVELQVEDSVGSGTFVSKAVAFSSTAKLSDEINLDTPLNVEAGVKVKVIKTNLDNLAQNLYTTIIGVEK